MLLSEAAPTLTLAYPNGRTAFEILKDRSIQADFEGHTIPMESAASYFATSHNYAWRVAKPWWTHPAVFVTALLAAGVAAWFTRYRQNQHQ